MQGWCRTTEYTETVVRCVVGVEYGFKVGVGYIRDLQSPFLVVMVMDRLTEYADDTVICRESREQVLESIKR